MQDLLPAIHSNAGDVSYTNTMQQHIVLVTQSSFCAVRQPSSSVLTSDQPTVMTSTRLITASGGMMQKRVHHLSAIRTSCR